MEIINFQKVRKPLGKTRAFFTLETTQFYIHHCRLVETDSGKLVAYLPRFGKNDPVVTFKDPDYLEYIGELAAVIYASKK
jgi:hypothetical protein